MSDKPPVQQHVAETISSLIHVLPSTLQMHYIQCFWMTIIKEWNNIDRLRLI
jgi:ribosomal RNA-processing protein 1